MPSVWNLEPSVWNFESSTKLDKNDLIDCCKRFNDQVIIIDESHDTLEIYWPGFGEFIVTIANNGLLVEFQRTGRDTCAFKFKPIFERFKATFVL